MRDSLCIEVLNSYFAAQHGNIPQKNKEFYESY